MTGIIPVEWEVFPQPAVLRLKELVSQLERSDATNIDKTAMRMFLKELALEKRNATSGR